MLNCSDLKIINLIKNNRVLCKPVGIYGTEWVAMKPLNQLGRLFQWWSRLRNRPLGSVFIFANQKEEGRFENGYLFQLGANKILKLR